jgi:DNA-binding GntR family transcriptional regulator
MTVPKRERSALLVDDLASEIQSQVMLGDIPIGSWLRQEHLAEQFGVSRTPVREAIRKLQASGVVELVPHRGALVRGPDLQDIHEAYVVRAELEGLAAELASGLVDDDTLRELDQAEELFERALAEFTSLERGARVEGEARQEWVRANDLFHQTVQRAAGNRRLRQAIADVHRTFPRALTVRPLVEDPSLAGPNVAEHRAIRDALVSRDGTAAREAMRAHVLRAGELVAEWFDRHREDGAGSEHRAA